jgi:hypothetical protein
MVYTIKINNITSHNSIIDTLATPIRNYTYSSFTNGLIVFNYADNDDGTLSDYQTIDDNGLTISGYIIFASPQVNVNILVTNIPLTYTLSLALYDSRIACKANSCTITTKIVTNPQSIFLSGNSDLDAHYSSSISNNHGISPHDNYYGTFQMYAS